METFGERLKNLIKSSDLKTVKSFAEETGLHKVTVSNVIRGRNNPSYDVIMACLELFSYDDVHWLLTGERKGDLERLKVEVSQLRSKLEKVGKPSSNRIQPSVTL